MNEQLNEMLKGNPVLADIYRNAKTNSILVLDEDGYILALNEAFQHDYGYTEDDLVGVHTRVLFTEEDQKALLPEIEIEKVKQHGFALDRNYTVRHDGTCFWVSGESLYTKSEHGKAFIIKFIQNIHEQKLMEKFLKESSNFSESVIGSIQDGVLVIDFEYKILKVNQCFNSIFELKDQRIEGKHLAEVNYSFFTSGELVSLLQNIKETESSFEAIELQWKTMSGITKTLSVKVGLLDGKMSNKRILLVFSDVTKARIAHQMADESARRFRFLIEAIPQKVWTADRNGNSDFFNGHWLEYTGLSLEELTGNGWEMVIHPEDWENIKDMKYEAIRKGEDFTYEYRILRKDGAYRWHLVRGIANRDEEGKVEMWVGTCTDVHDRKMLEEELELRVKERTGELQQSNEQLEISNLELEQFAVIASHDLQEPLRKLLVFGDRLQSQAAGKLDHEETTFLQKMLQSAHRMRELIIGVLNMSRLNPALNMHQFVQVNLNDILQNVLSDLEIEIEQTEAEITFDNLPVIEAVELQMNQLFLNLISNSLKFQPQNNRPVIQITCSELSPWELQSYNVEGDHKYVKLVFTDNGLGFDDRFSSQVFGFFKRLYANGEFPGTGIGLALCKKIAENHKGVISVRSEEGKGSVFTIILPQKQK